MATLDDIHALGYTITDHGDVLEVTGFDLRFLISAADQEAIDWLANVPLHEERVRRPSRMTLPEMEMEKTLRDRAIDAIDNLQDADANWGSLTANDKDAVLRLLVKCALAIIRLRFRKLEGV